MLRIQSVAWIAALAAGLLISQESFAQKGGGGGRGGGSIGGARIGGGGSIGGARIGGGGIHVGPSVGSIRSAAPVGPARIGSVSPSIAPRMNTPVLNNRPISGLTAPNNIGSAALANRSIGGLGGAKGNAAFIGSRPSSALANNLSHNANLGNLHGRPSDGHLHNNFNHNNINHNHNHFFNGFFGFGLGLGFNDFWPWYALNPGYGYFGGAYPYYDYPLYGNYASAMPWLDYVPGVPNLGQQDPQLQQLPMPQTLDLNAQIDVLVPDANAQVWFDGNPTTSRGTTRYFDSPALQQGGKYNYTIRAAWMENGQLMTAERTVSVTVGSQLVIDFTQTPPKVTQVR